MYKKIKFEKTKIRGVKPYIAESIEDKVKRILNNKEPIKDGAPIIYTERKDGVLPSYNIRTDRFEVAIDAMEAVSKSHIAKREARQAAKVVEMKKKEEGETGGQSIQGTDGN